MGERLVIVGGDAGGMAAISKVRARRRDMEIVVLEKGRHTSYSACGIPYVVAGTIPTIGDLVVRSPQDFRDRDRVDVRLRHEAMEIDLERAEVEVRAHDLDRTIRLSFDHLILATGGAPVRPPLPGIELPHISGVQNLDDVPMLLDRAREGVEHVVVVGGGYIGLEMAEAFATRGSHVTVVEASEQLLSSFDADMAAMVAEAMTRHGIEVRCKEAVDGFEPGAVVTTAERLNSDLVVLGIGVAPNAALASAAGIATGVKGAVRVDRRQRTSATNVWAAGDCCESFHRVSRQPVHVPLGTVANRQSRVVGINIGGGYATFPGVLGTAVSRVCDTEFARTGLSSREATAAGFGHVEATITGSSRVEYFPGRQSITVKLLAETGTGRVLGAQIVGREGTAKRIDVLATAIWNEMTVEEMIDLDLGYAPPFGPVWDPVVVAAREAAKLV